MVAGQIVELFHKQGCIVEYTTCGEFLGAICFIEVPVKANETALSDLAHHTAMSDREAFGPALAGNPLQVILSESGALSPVQDIPGSEPLCRSDLAHSGTEKDAPIQRTQSDGILLERAWAVLERHFPEAPSPPEPTRFYRSSSAPEQFNRSSY